MKNANLEFLLALFADRQLTVVTLPKPGSESIWVSKIFGQEKIMSIHVSINYLLFIVALLLLAVVVVVVVVFALNHFLWLLHFVLTTAR